FLPKVTIALASMSRPQRFRKKAKVNAQKHSCPVERQLGRAPKRRITESKSSFWAPEYRAFFTPDTQNNLAGTQKDTLIRSDLHGRDPPAGMGTDSLMHWGQGSCALRSV